MMSFNLLYEDVVLRKDVGQGLGGYLGRITGGVGGALGGLSLGAALGGGLGSMGGPIGAAIGLRGGAILGGQLGKLIGRNVISDPERAADFSKASHRIGHLAKPMTGGWGVVGDIVHPGLTTQIGSLYQGVSDEGARKLGYQTGGRLGTALFGPLAGIVSPDKVAVNK